MSELQVVNLASGSSGTGGWARWFFLAMAAHALYCIFSAGQRNAVYGEFYKARFMRRTGSPASARTAFLAFVFWGTGFVSFLRPRFWDWDYSGVFALVLLATVMLSSYLDARAFRNRNWR